MAQQRRVALGEHLRMDLFVHRRAESIRLVGFRHAPELPYRRLQTTTQALEAFRETNRPPFPVRVRQHEVVHQVIEALAINTNPQRVHRREVRLTQKSRLVPLLEEHFLRWPFLRSPILGMSRLLLNLVG